MDGKRGINLVYYSRPGKVFKKVDVVLICIFKYECVHEIFRDVLWFLVLFSKSVFRLCSMTRLILSDLCPVYV